MSIEEVDRMKAGRFFARRTWLKQASVPKFQKNEEVTIITIGKKAVALTILGAFVLSLAVTVLPDRAERYFSTALL